MNELKRSSTFVWVLLFIATFGLSNFVLAAKLNVYKNDAWYSKVYYWILGGLLFIFPLFIMLPVFYIQICCGIAKKLNVPGSSVYNTPYSWILCLIVPIIGWSLGIVMLVYILIYPFAELALGESEKYIN